MYICAPCNSRGVNLGVESRRNVWYNRRCRQTHQCREIANASTGDMVAASSTNELCVVPR